MKLSTSVKTYGTGFIDSLAVETTTAEDIVMAMEQKFYEPEPFVSLMSLENLDLQEHLKMLDERAVERAIEAVRYNNLGQYDPDLAKKPLKEMENPNMELYYPCGFTRNAIEVSPNKWVKIDDETYAYLSQAKADVKPIKAESPDLEKNANNMIFAIRRYEALKKWIEKEEEPLNLRHYKTTEDLVFELPPRFKGRSNVQAFFKITSPSGKVIDLSVSTEKYNRIKAANPNKAFHLILARLGARIDSGETEILNKLLKADKIQHTDERGNTTSEYKWIPSFVSKKIGVHWYVTVGWRLNPKCHYGTFHRDVNTETLRAHNEKIASLKWFDAAYQELPESYNPMIETIDGELQPYVVGGIETDILTASQLDYKLLCEDSGLAVEDFDGDVIEYMNESEEFVQQGMMRDDDHSEEKIESFMLVATAERMNRLIDLRCESAVWLMDDFDEALYETTLEVARECAHLKKQIKIVDKKIKAHALKYMTTPAEGEFAKMVQEIGKQLAKDKAILKHKLTNKRLNYRTERDSLIGQTKTTEKSNPILLKACSPTPQSKQADSYHGESNWKDVGYERAFIDHTHHVVIPIPNAHRSPNGDIEAPSVLESLERPPAGRVTMMQRVKQGTTALIATKDGYVKKWIPKAPERPTSASNASPQLMEVLRRMIRENETGFAL